MAKKGKPKISKVKRNNQTTNKMKKQGKLKLQRHRQKVQKQKQPTKPEVEYSSESEASADEWADMLDEEEQEYIMSRLSKQPQLLSNVPEQEKTNKSSRKRKKEKKERLPRPVTAGSDSGADTDECSDSELEEKYEKELGERPVKRMRPLLPIKTKQGLQERAEECEETVEEETSNVQDKEESSQTDSESEESDSGQGTGEEGELAQSEPSEDRVITAVELLAARRDKLQHDKLRIGALCSSLLESPEKKLKNLFPILYLMEERLKDGALNLHSVRKLAMLSAFEVFKDILPDYQIRHQDYSNVKLKKDTLALYKYEKELLEFYKRYLQRLEKAASVLRRKKGDTRKPDESSVGLAIVSLRCMCGLLVGRPNFNYASNIAQSVIPFLDCREPQARSIVSDACANVFAEDKRGDITLTVVRLINQLVKRRGERLHPSAVDCLLTLRIRDVDMDAEADVKHKKKMDEKRKKRIVNLSKKEKKRAKKLKEVERELLETEAQESEMARRKQLTEVTKTVFHIYFRLLKTAPSSKLLAAALNGLAKFTHVINLEFYSDLVAIVGRLLEDQLVGQRERILCVRTALAILAGTGDSLNVDPAKFHAYLYSHALIPHAGSWDSDARVVLEAVSEICARARRVSSSVLCAFGKRLATLATQLLHNGAIASLLLLHQLAQQSKAMSGLLELESEAVGSGKYDPLSRSPEYCNANAAKAHEVALLRRHYHPTVRGLAENITKGTLPADISKLRPLEAFDLYSCSQMAFKPSIPPPRPGQTAKNTAKHVWAQPAFKQLCEQIESDTSLLIT